jgi:DNA integrity scanning protein DisA with diadenylate cyclase activity
MDSFPLTVTQKITESSNLVDGIRFCYLLENTGMLVIKKIPSDLKGENCAETFCNISEVFDTMCCYIDKYVKIFYSGELVKIYRKGNWLFTCEAEEKLRQLNFPYEILSRILNICISMSENEQGSCFVIQKEYDDSNLIPLNKNSRFVGNIKSIGNAFLINCASSLDGAIVIHESGDVIGIAQKLNPLSETNYESEAGRGTKHKSTCHYTSVCESVGFVVSEDGPISIYVDGQLHHRCFGELFD